MVFNRFGPPEVLEVVEMPTPQPAPDEVLVRVAAVSIGRLLDLLTRSGKHPYVRLEPPHILGADHCGVVVRAGLEVTHLKVGDRVATFPCVTCRDCAACRSGHDDLCAGFGVIGTHRPGAYAEYVSVPARNANVVPADIDPVDATTLALSGPIAVNQFTKAGLKHDQWILVQAAASALGSTTAAYARFCGANVVVTSRSERKRQTLTGLGFHTLDATAPDFSDQLLSLTHGRGVDIAVD
ncbi:MAG: alcohol dehydrogenase catalytic domain-containing protein, partial [Mycobacterium sp.]